MAAIFLIGAVLAVTLPPPWLYVPRGTMRAIAVMDVVVGLPVASMAFQLIAVGNGFLPLVKCWREDRELHIAVSAAMDPLFRHRAVLGPGNAVIALSRETIERGAARTTIRITQHGQTRSLFTPFRVDHSTIREIVAFADENGVEIEIEDGESGAS